MPVVVSGKGWRPSETVNFLFHETNGSNPDVTFQSVADKSGNVSNSQFAPRANDYGVVFILTATGLVSGLTAQTSFTDGASLNQCGNLASGAPANCSWQTGNLNSSSAHW